MQNMISVIIPVYNAEAYIGRCLDSIISQSYKNFEIICVINGCVDKSLEICQKYSKENENIKLDIIVLQKFVGQPVFGNTFAQLEISITGGDDFKLMSMPERADNNDGKWYYVTENSTELPYGTHLDSSGIEFKNQNTELKNITFSQITNPNDLQSYDKIELSADSYLLGDIDNVNIGFNADGQHPVLILKINEEFDSNGNLSIAPPPVHSETYSYRIAIRNPYTIHGDFGPEAQLSYLINGHQYKHH